MAKRFLTNADNVFAAEDLSIKSPSHLPEMELVKIYPSIAYQKIDGFGAALTEASAYVFSNMDNADKIKFALACFGPGGNAYSLARISIQSCDFSLKPRSYLKKKPAGVDLSKFSLGEDLDYVVPMAKVALAANPDMKFLASPWSPPAWAKSNKSMKKGGRLKDDCREVWAAMIARAVSEYRTLGIPITHVTIQNEPCAKQTWESCLFDAVDEAKFACNFLKPALLKEDLSDVKILAWDHNKEHIVDRILETMENPEWIKSLDGFAFHWYSGDHFEALAEARRLLGDDLDLVFSEGCEAYSAWRKERELDHAEHYAHEIIGDLKAGANAIYDWNILLDEYGGPNHVKNFCDAPIMYDMKTKTLNVRLPFHYIGHFSRFVLPGSNRILSSSYTSALETVAFEREDGLLVLVVFNKTGEYIPFSVAFEKDSQYIQDVGAPAHSIQTILI